MGVAKIRSFLSVWTGHELGHHGCTKVVITMFELEKLDWPLGEAGVDPAGIAGVI